MAENSQPPSLPTYDQVVKSPQAVADRIDQRENQMGIHNNQPPYPQPCTNQFPMSPATTAVIVTQNVNTVVFGSEPIQVTCHQCLQTVMTSTEKSLRGQAITLSALLCLVGGLLCFWIPFVMDNMYSTNHKCPVCQAHLGSYNR